MKLTNLIKYRKTVSAFEKWKNSCNIAFEKCNISLNIAFEKCKNVSEKRN
jgi:hypothetical protein